MTRLAAVAIAALSAVTLLSGAQSAARPPTVTVDAGARLGTLNMQLDTQFHFPYGVLDKAPEARPLFRALGAPVVRILASSDGCCWPGGPGPVIPAGKLKGSWDFGPLDAVVNDISAAGAQTVLGVFHAPEWMWSCPTGTIRDGTFAEFGDYMARLVAYYNTGSFLAEDGRTIVNPAGVSNRIKYWELWNEPDWRSIACPPDGNKNITAAQYVTMWNATVPKMLAVDPSIKLIGPCASPAGNASGNYLAELMAGATRKPDIISFHWYGGWANSQGDQFFLRGLDGIERAFAQVRAIAPGIPIWITEINVSSDWGDDPARRPYNAYGAAWGASAFRRLALGGASALFSYQFAHPNNPDFQMIDPDTGQPRLPYWRDYYLARYFPPGSTLLSSSSSVAGVEALAARTPGSGSVHVLLVNRQVDSPTSVGGPGLPATVHVTVENLTGISQVNLRQLDNATPLAEGPPAMALLVGKSVTVNFAGYGAAILDFVTTAAAASEAG